jgi:hypothetical protein
VGDLALPWVVGLVTLVARLATAATGPTDWDSSQFAAAIARFDVTHGRPQPPGYFLYVEAGRLVHAAGPSPIDSLVLVSAVASAVAAGLVVVAGRDLGGRWVGLAAGLIVATSPFAWYSGSIVDTYSFDLLIASLLMILAWRARPHSWHGAAAMASLGLVAGFRQSALQTFAMLGLLAVAGSVRRVREGVAAVLAGVVAVALWLVPMALSQPGGLHAWARATRLEADGAARATSVLDHASGGALNFGTFAGYTTVALAPLAALALVAAVLLGVRRLLGSGTADPSPVDRRGPDGQPDRSGPGDSFFAAPDRASGAPGAPFGASTVASLRELSDPWPGAPDPWPGASDREAAHPWDGGWAPPPGEPTPRRNAGRRGVEDWIRPWYQSRTAILVAAIVPPVAVVTLVQFAKGGYVLAYLPGAVIALLLVPAALVRRRGVEPAPGSRRGALATVWLVVASLAVAGIAVLGAQRFLDGTGVLPAASSVSSHGLWLTQARYQAPYADTRAAIRSADTIDTALASLAPYVHPGRDVVVIDTVDGGSAFYRNAGWELPRDRVALIVPRGAIYNEQDGSLYYTLRTTIPVGPGGAVYLIAPPSLPGLAHLAGDGKAQTTRAPHIGDWRVWRIAPGARILGVDVVVSSGPRPLGTGLGTAAPSRRPG